MRRKSRAKGMADILPTESDSGFHNPGGNDLLTIAGGVDGQFHAPVPERDSAQMADARRAKKAA